LYVPHKLRSNAGKKKSKNRDGWQTWFPQNLFHESMVHSRESRPVGTHHKGGFTRNVAMIVFHDFVSCDLRAWFQKAAHVSWRWLDVNSIFIQEDGIVGGGSFHDWNICIYIQGLILYKPIVTGLWMTISRSWITNCLFTHSVNHDSTNHDRGSTLSRPAYDATYFADSLLYLWNRMYDDLTFIYE